MARKSHEAGRLQARVSWIRLKSFLYSRFIPCRTIGVSYVVTGLQNHRILLLHMKFIVMLHIILVPILFAFPALRQVIKTS